ncbi:hypothetical protein BZZ01_05085 [Nostocales cyanobacterium HT-58-2]|nr:hypothetical protein BZZ01_05085 [Nostocales cyanobacterium HT-58-2]
MAQILLFLENEPQKTVDVINHLGISQTMTLLNLRKLRKDRKILYLRGAYHNAPGWWALPKDEESLRQKATPQTVEKRFLRALKDHEALSTEQIAKILGINLPHAQTAGKSLLHRKKVRSWVVGEERFFALP